MRADAKSTAGVFVEKGKRKKTEKAVRNMIREGSTTKFICRVSEVSPDYVARIRQEILRITLSTATFVPRNE